MSSRTATAFIGTITVLVAAVIVLGVSYSDQQHRNQELLLKIADLNNEIFTLKNQPKSSDAILPFPESGISSDDPGGTYRGSTPPSHKTEEASSVETSSSGSAVETVKQFFQACVDHDYDRASSCWDKHVGTVHLNPLWNMPLYQFINILMAMSQSELDKLSFGLNGDDFNAKIEVTDSAGKSVPQINCRLRFQMAKVDGDWEVLDVLAHDN